MRVTEAMKKIGGQIITRELGAQFTPDWFDEKEIAERVFLSMLALAQSEASTQEASGNRGVSVREK